MEPPRRTRIARRVAFAALVLLTALAVIGGWAAARPIRLTVDGEDVTVRSGATIENLIDRGDLASTPGDLLAVDGTVLQRGGGTSPRVTRNGRQVPFDERVYSSDTVVSERGRDITETAVTTQAVLPSRTLYKGSGSLLEIGSVGTQGLERKTYGAISGIVVTSTVLKAPVDTVIMRRSPHPGERVVALTFDDGPWPHSTRRILSILRTERVRATFFLLGRQVKHNPTLAREVADQGHLVASHTYGHKMLTRLKKGKIRKEIKSADAVIKRVTGVHPVWMRPPYGATNGLVLSQAKKLHERVVLWDVDSYDWKKPGAKKIAASVLKHAKPGSIVLLHDGGGNRDQTVRALSIIIERLRAKGYKFVTVDEIVRMRAAQKRLRRASSSGG